MDFDDYEFDDDYSSNPEPSPPPFVEGMFKLTRLLEFAAFNLGGWITPEVAAWVIYFSNANRKKRAEALIRRAVKAGFLVPRKLDGRRKIYVLTKAGCIRVGYFPNTPPTAWGRKNEAGIWSPPATFEHDLLSLLYCLWHSLNTFGGICFYTEHQIAVLNDKLAKIPDALSEEHNGEWTWVETERARKSGKNMRIMIRFAVAAAMGRGPRIRISDKEFVQPTGALFLLPLAGHRDDRGHNINHRQRLVSAIKAHIGDLHVQLERSIRFRFFQQTRDGWEELPPFEISPRQKPASGW